jgi:hypothetical protein
LGFSVRSKLKKNVKAKSLIKDTYVCKVICIQNSVAEPKLFRSAPVPAPQKVAARNIDPKDPSSLINA